MYRFSIALTLVACVFTTAIPQIAHAQKLKTENVILITTDGLRWQEVFTGAEEALMTKDIGGVANVEKLKKDFWRDTPEARREALMPFLWSTVAKNGQLFGNATAASVARITNTMKFSYPGYNEILTGAFDPRIDSNGSIPNPNVTILEWLNKKPDFNGKVAAFSAWRIMTFIVNRDRCGFPVMGGWEHVPNQNPNEREKLLNELIDQTTPDSPGEVYDSFLYHAAREHFIANQPRVFFLSFLETDHFGHQGRYDKLLNSAHAVDDYIRMVWEGVQSSEKYKDKTTLIITTDHGRGSGPVEWKNHGKEVVGAENIWIAVLGPDTPALGERKNIPPVTQSQIAATLAVFFGQDYRKDVPSAGAPIADVLPGK